MCNFKAVPGLVDGDKGGLHPQLFLWLACRFLFLKIMAILTELRSINAQHTQRLLRIQDIHPFASPLMRELFGITDG